MTNYARVDFIRILLFREFRQINRQRAILTIDRAVRDRDKAIFQHHDGNRQSPSEPAPMRRRLASPEWPGFPNQAKPAQSTSPLPTNDAPPYPIPYSNTMLRPFLNDGTGTGITVLGALQVLDVTMWRGASSEGWMPQGGALLLP